MRLLLALPFLLVVAAPLAETADQTAPEERIRRDSYALGYDFGDRLRKFELNLDAEALVSAVRDALAGRPPTLGYEQVTELVEALHRKMVLRQQQKLRQNPPKTPQEPSRP